ncbi:uncharacterized protein LOC128392621 isoform X2 [Panonychus citri]|nr:uncharacterized protein LOC128392621 isoform X2 [Panonychus citri]
MKHDDSDFPYWGLPSDLGIVYYWTTFRDSARPRTLQANAELPMRIISRMPREIKSIFTVTIKSGFAYCASYNNGRGNQAGFVCHDDKNDILVNETGHLFEAIDLFHHGDKPMGVLFQIFNAYSWYQYFEIEFQPNNLLKLNRVSSWFHESDPFDGCFPSFCYGLIVEMALRYNNTFYLGSNQLVVVTNDLNYHTGNVRQPTQNEGFLKHYSLTAVDSFVFYYQDRAIHQVNPPRGLLKVELGQGEADASFTLRTNHSTRLFFLKDSVYRTVLYVPDAAVNLITDTEYDWRLKDVDLNSDWIPLITDFNSFMYVDSALELTRDRIIFFYGSYYMIITNWTEDGHPIPLDYPVQIISSSFFNCQGASYSNTPYETFNASIEFLEAYLPKRYQIPPDEVLHSIFLILGLTVSSLTCASIVVSLSIIVISSKCREKVQTKAQGVAIQTMEDQSSSETETRNSPKKVEVIKEIKSSKYKAGKRIKSPSRPRDRNK